MIVENVSESGYEYRVILVDDLNPEDLAMVQALKARSGESSEVPIKRVYDARRGALKGVLSKWAIDFTDPDAERQGLDDLMAVASHDDASALARRIGNDFVVGFGHKSVADGAFTTVVLEGVSILCAKAVQDHFAFGGVETSTRAVDMALAKFIDPLRAAAGEVGAAGAGDDARATEVLRRLREFYASSWPAVADEVRWRYPRRDGEDKKKYEGAVKYRTFDVLRAFLPAGAATNLSVTMNLRQHGDLLTRLLVHPLAEVRAVAGTWAQMLRDRYPSSGDFGAEAGVSGVGRDGRAAERAAWNQRVAGLRHGSCYQRVVCDDIDDEPRLALRAAPYYDDIDFVELSTDERRAYLAERPRGALLPRWMDDLGQVRATFPLDYGSWRDIQRQRVLVLRHPLLTPDLGFESWYLDQLPCDRATQLRAKACNLLDWVEGAVAALLCSPAEKQYYLPMGYRVPASFSVGLPGLAYVVELRTGATVHPTLRRAILNHVLKPFRARHPEVTLHADESPDPWDLRRGGQTIERKIDDVDAIVRSAIAKES